MQPPSLEPIRLRMGRANHHAQELGREIGSFYATKPYEVVAEFDPEPEDPLMNDRNGAHIVRARVHHPIPTSVPLLAGETLQAMRSALDYVAWQLALARSESPPQTTAFPYSPLRRSTAGIGSVSSAASPRRYTPFSTRYSRTTLGTRRQSTRFGCCTGSPTTTSTRSRMSSHRCRAASKLRGPRASMSPSP